MRLRTLNTRLLGAPLNGWAWLATIILLTLHWSVPAFTLFEVGAGSGGGPEYATNVGDQQPARVAQRGAFGQSFSVLERPETYEFRAESPAIIPPVSAPKSLDQFEHRRIAPTSSAPRNPWHHFFARAPPLMQG